MKKSKSRINRNWLGRISSIAGLALSLLLAPQLGYALLGLGDTSATSWLESLLPGAVGLLVIAGTLFSIGWAKEVFHASRHAGDQAPPAGLSS